MKTGHQADDLGSQPTWRLGYRELYLPIWLPVLVAALFLAPTVHAGEVGSIYAVLKLLESRQGDTNPPVLKNSPYHWVTFFLENSSGSVSSGSVSLPAGSMAFSPEPILYLGGTTFQQELKYPDLGSLNTDFADGTYALSITGASSTVYHASLSLTGGVYPSVTPKLTNSTNWLTGAQIVDPTTSFTFNWTAFTGATISDAVILLFQDAAGVAVSLQILPAATTSQNFPAALLLPNQFYSFNIIFLKVVATDTTDISGSTGYVGYATSNTITVATPQLRTTAISKTTSGGNIFLQTTSVGLPSLNYSTRSVTDLQQAFQPLGTAASDANGTILYNPPGTSDARRFYRITYP